MRIISGDYRFRNIAAPEDRSVRPTGDKVKGAMFNIVQDRINGANVCALFAGSGNLGLEALSRGAARCWFGDNSRQSIRYIRENIRKCGAEEKSGVVQGGSAKTLDRIDGKVDIFLIDPPYGSGLLVKSIELISEMDLLAEDGVIIAEHERRDDVPDEIGKYRKIKEKKYGIVVLSIFIC